MIVAPFERHLAFEGCFNFRDLGGYRAADGRVVRWRRLFRSDTLSEMTARDAERAQRELGIATVIDLRSAKEVDRNGLGLLVDMPIDYVHLPLIDDVRRSFDETEPYPARLVELYARMLAGGASRIAGALARLASASAYPAVFHCAAGKDRTGVLAAVILSVIGVEDDQIIGDYALTTAYIQRIINRTGSSSGYEPAVRGLPAEMHLSVPETMASFLARVRGDYGSMTAFVRKTGGDEGVLSRLKEQLLERSTQVI